MKQLLIGCLGFGVCSLLLAAVPVEDRSLGSGQSAKPSSGEARTFAYPDDSNAGPGSTAPPQPVEPTDTYSILQTLRQEVMELRGMVEQLNHELAQLKQRQVDDYMDLDRRISGSMNTQQGAGNSQAQQQVAKPAVKSAQPSQSSDSNQPSPSPASGSELERYSAAYNLLKEGKIDQAKTALQQHTRDFPDGQYAPNAYYWLGEIYMLENDLEKAAQSFETVVNRFPAHDKTPDARFKLGKAYHLAGNPKAREVLQQAASGTGSSANLARQYLRENF